MGGLAGAAALALAGCDSEARPARGPARGARGRSGFPVTVAGKLGSTTVTAPPRRVVAAGFLRDTDLAVALGAPLVGAAKIANFANGLAPWQRPTTSPALFVTSNGLPLERIAALRPDLILASDDYSLADDYSDLSQLAPVLGYATGVGADSWQQMCRRAGQVLGATDRATRLVHDAQQQITRTRDRYPQLGGATFTLGPVTGQGQIFTVTSARDASAAFFDQLGMRLSPQVTRLPRSGPPRRALISPERLELLDADVVILSYTTRAARTKLEADPLFQRVPAVRRGAYLGLDPAQAIALAFPSVLSIPYGLRTVAPWLAAALTRS